MKYLLYLGLLFATPTFAQKSEKDTTVLKEEYYELVHQLRQERETSAIEKKNFVTLIELSELLITYYRDRADRAEEIILKHGRKCDRKKYIYSPIKNK